MDDRRLSALVTAVIVLVLLGIFLDVFRRTLGRPGSTTAEVSAGAVSPLDSDRAFSPDSQTIRLPDSLAVGMSGTAAGLVQGLQPGDGAGGPSYMELVARAETRRQIRASAGMTYLSDIVAASGDSMLHRWDNRVTRPVRVYFRPGRAANYHPAFLESVRAALRTWEDAVPVRFEQATDSLDAEVHVIWKVQFDIDRTGQTDLSWNNFGHIERGVITLATFDPEGQPMGAEEIRIVALHEIGHLIGLDHSSDSGDVMFPIATARGLSRRDIETARLLYRLAPGSIR
jgi:hypothetical protein